MGGSGYDPELDAVENSLSSSASKFEYTARFKKLLAIELKQRVVDLLWFCCCFS